MTAFVLDASLAFSWCFEDEMTEQALELLEQLRRDAAVVPNVWYFEIANVLAISERRRRITRADSEVFLALLKSVDIETDADATSRAFGEILDVARQHSLSAYDASYLELAMRRGLPLASKDMALCAAAERVGVTVLRAA